MEFNIFISYSTHDLQQVQALQKQLVNTPINVFVAEHSIKPSEELATKISTAINNCDLFVVLWSENAKNSDWVSQEIGKATALNKKILPLVLDPDLNLPGFVSGLKYLPIYKNQEASLSEATEIALKEYEKKKTSLEALKVQKQKEKEALVKMGLGALFLWAISQG